MSEKLIIWKKVIDKEKKMKNYSLIIFLTVLYQLLLGMFDGHQIED